MVVAEVVFYLSKSSKTIMYKYSFAGKGVAFNICESTKILI